MGLCSTKGLTELETLSVASSGIRRIALVLYSTLEILVRIGVQVWKALLPEGLK